MLNIKVKRLSEFKRENLIDSFLFENGIQLKNYILTLSELSLGEFLLRQKVD